MNTVTTHSCSAPLEIMPTQEHARKFLTLWKTFFAKIVGALEPRKIDFGYHQWRELEYRNEMAHRLGERSFHFCIR